MKRFKQLLALTLAVVLFASGCGNSGKESSSDKEKGQAETEVAKDDAKAQDKQEKIEKIVIAAPKAPPVMPILRMKEAGLLGDTEIDLQVWDTPETLIGMVQSDAAAFYAVPLTVVSKLYNKGMGIQVLNTNTWGVASLVTSDPDLTSWSQLKGKKIYVALKSSPVDVFTRYFLKEAGVDPDNDCEIVYGSKAEIAQLIISGEAEYATLIEPQVTAAMMKNKDLRVAFSFEDEWQRIKGDNSRIPTAGFAVSKSFAEEHPQFTADFDAKYKEALQWVIDNPKEAAAMGEEYIGIKAPVLEKAIPKMGLYHVPSSTLKPILDGYYQMLFDFDPSTIGGKVPDEGFYFTK
ncbi:MAG: ABC transporter substrate-binding protein [Eubacteriales bacterium]|nr:ABC transporter substrate-binding protein [Eubacteriales bacterium]